MSDMITETVSSCAYREFQNRYDVFVEKGEIQPLFHDLPVDKYSQSLYAGDQIEDILDAIYLQGVTDLGKLMAVSRGFINPMLIINELNHFTSWSNGETQ
ncbi:MAG: hypothetical protein CMF22_11585 [Idiomarinaceae bacterium]|nr:hypothetical protein [Idiomarinaceae bacterium]|tara:strand:- start:74828 stop:75127 length:300 start_codon:yes stop_codon:yes gene_type:complete